MMRAVLSVLLVPVFRAPSSTAQTIGDTVASDPRFATFFEFDQLVDGGNFLLTTTSPITVFVPTENAFGKMDEAFVAKLQTLEWRMHMKDMVDYHIADPDLYTFDFFDGREIGSFNQETVSISVSTDGNITLSAGNAVIVAPDIAVSNGVIHGIGSVLTPFWMTNSLLDLAVLFPGTSILLELFSFTGLDQVLLDANGPYTLLAPSNIDVVLVDPAIQPYTTDEEYMTNFLSYHIVRGNVDPSNLQEVPEITTLLGETVEISLSSSSTTVNGANIRQRSLASNGVFIVLENFLIPPTLEDVMSKQPGIFGTLLALFEMSGHLNALAPPKKGTLLAPNNEAVERLPASLFAKLQQPEYSYHLRDLLDHHIIPDQIVKSSSIVDGSMMTSANGDQLSFSMSPTGTVLINTISTVITPDILAYNPAIIHTIDTVLEPAWIGRDVLATIQADDDLTTFRDLLLSTALTNEILNADRPFTIFAPLDSAFQDLAIQYEDLDFDDTDLMRTILQAHVIPGIFTSDQLVGRAELASTSGEVLIFNEHTGTESTFTVNGVPIAVTFDALADNGIIHHVNKVILPVDLVLGPVTNIPTQMPICIDIGDDTQETAHPTNRPTEIPTTIPTGMPTGIPTKMPPESPLVLQPTNTSSPSALAAENSDEIISTVPPTESPSAPSIETSRAHGKACLFCVGAVAIVTLLLY